MSKTQQSAQPLATHSQDCSCPIHDDGAVPTLPRGIDFADRVTVAPINPSTAGEIYEAHHSYKPEMPNVTFDDGNHGIYVGDHLVGAISYNYHIINKLKLYIEDNNSFHRNDSRGSDEDKHILMGNRFAHVARICIGVDMHNLASCALAKSQEYFVENTDKDVDFLLTFIRGDHVGSMLKALNDKGWQLTGHTRSSTGSGNREETDIHNWTKQRWLCAIDDSLEQIKSCDCEDDMLEMVGKSHVCSECKQWYGFDGHSWAPNN